MEEGRSKQTLKDSVPGLGNKGEPLSEKGSVKAKILVLKNNGLFIILQNFDFMDNFMGVSRCFYQT